jgi:hypothetical protein
MSSLWEQRAARNEALFREVNQNIALLEERHGTTVSEPVFLCECADSGCTEQLAVDADTFRRVREQPRLFLLRPGHDDPQLERVVEKHREYVIVEKTGEAGRVAEEVQRDPGALS